MGGKISSKTMRDIEASVKQLEREGFTVDFVASLAVWHTVISGNNEFAGIMVQINDAYDGEFGQEEGEDWDYDFVIRAFRAAQEKRVDFFVTLEEEF